MISLLCSLQAKGFQKRLFKLHLLQVYVPPPVFLNTTQYTKRTSHTCHVCMYTTFTYCFLLPRIHPVQIQLVNIVSLLQTIDSFLFIFPFTRHHWVRYHRRHHCHLGPNQYVSEISSFHHDHYYFWHHLYL